MNVWLPGGKLGEGRIREFGVDMYTLRYLKMDNQEGPTVEHRELCLLSCGSLDRREVWGEYGYMRMYGRVPLLIT